MMNTDGDIPPPQPSTPGQHYREPRPFSGKPGEDVEEWLKHYRRVSLYNHWDTASQRNNVPLFLEGTALMWYENHEENLTTWANFVDEIKKCFGDPTMKKKRAEQTLSQRAQVPGETCTMYIEEVLKLCKSVDPVMTDEDKVGHLLKGIAEDIYHYLIGKDDLQSANDIIRHCRTFEALKARRISAKFGRLPNVTTVASIDVGPPSSDLASTIRQIVREELDRRDAAATSIAHVRGAFTPCGPLPVSINAAGFDDARTPVQPRRHTHIYEPPNDGIRRSPTDITAWQDHPADCLQQRVVREAPVCFHCGVRGHIARFCPERRRAPLPQYERPPASSRRTSTRGDYRWPPNSYYRNDIQQSYRSDSPASVRSVTPPTSRQRRSPSPGRRRLTSPPPGN